MKLLFVESFKKIDKKFIYVVLFDFLFYLGIAAAVLIVSKLLIWSLGSFFMLPGKLMAMSKMSDLAQLGASDDLGMLLNQFKGKLALTFIVLWFLFVLVFTFFKGPAWSFVTKQRLNKKYLLQFCKLNLWLLGSIMVLCLLFFWLTKPAVTGFVLLLIFSIALYLAPILYAVFNPNTAIKDLFKKMWFVGVERFYYFLLPWIIAQVLVLVIIVVVGLLASFFPSGGAFILFAAMILWQAWFKYYIYLVARSIK